MSITEIARRVGVSYVTVSRALNTPEKVSPETLTKIRHVCHEMNFSPRVIPNRIRTVCLIIPAPAHFYVADTIMISTIVPLLNGHGHHVVVSPLPEIERSPAIFQRAFIGILHQEDEKALAVARKFAAKQPFVTVDDLNERLAPNAISVASDHRQGVIMAIDYFLQRGHRRIAYVGLNLPGRGFRERFSAYKEIMERNDLYRESLVFQNDDALLLEGVRRVCEEGVTAIFCTDPAAISKVAYYLRILGKEIPRDVSFIGLEHQGGPRLLYPPVTCLVQPLLRVGELAVSKLMKRIAGEPIDERSCRAPYELAERESVRSL